MKDKALKFKTPAPLSAGGVQYLREKCDGDECKLQFVLWSRGTWLDIAGIYQDGPVFRPAACAWEAWKAAWALRS